MKSVKNVTMLIRLSEAEKKYFQECAIASGMSLSHWIRTKLTIRVEEEPNKKPSHSELQEMIKKIEDKPFQIKRASINRETYQKEEWVDPI